MYTVKNTKYIAIINIHSTWNLPLSLVVVPGEKSRFPPQCDQDLSIFHTLCDKDYHINGFIGFTGLRFR